MVLVECAEIRWRHVKSRNPEYRFLSAWSMARNAGLDLMRGQNAHSGLQNRETPGRNDREGRPGPLARRVTAGHHKESNDYFR